MSTQLVPFSFESNEIRAMQDEGGNPWFVAKDVAEALGISWSSATLNPIKAAWKGMMKFITPGGEQELAVICEQAVYKLAFRSRKPEAERFTDWVAEVIATIRKTGQYIQPKFRPERTRKALPGKLTIEQQDAVKALIKSRVEIMPHDQQAKAAITCWSAIKSKFGVSYKEVPAEQFADVLSLVARLELDKAQPKALPFHVHYPMETAAPPVGYNGLSGAVFCESAWSDPGWELLMKLREVGFNVDGPLYSHYAKLHVIKIMRTTLAGKANDMLDALCATLPYAPIYIR